MQSNWILQYYLWQKNFTFCVYWILGIPPIINDEELINFKVINSYHPVKVAVVNISTEYSFKCVLDSLYLFIYFCKKKKKKVDQLQIQFCHAFSYLSMWSKSFQMCC